MPHAIDLAKILGAGRPNDDRRLLGPAARTAEVQVEINEKLFGRAIFLGTYERVVAHSEPGCCVPHDAARREKRLRLTDL